VVLPATTPPVRATGGSSRKVTPFPSVDIRCSRNSHYQFGSAQEVIAGFLACVDSVTFLKRHDLHPNMLRVLTSDVLVGRGSNPTWFYVTDAFVENFQEDSHGRRVILLVFNTLTNQCHTVSATDVVEIRSRSATPPLDHSALVAIETAEDQFLAQHQARLETRRARSGPGEMSAGGKDVEGNGALSALLLGRDPAAVSDLDLSSAVPRSHHKPDSARDGRPKSLASAGSVAAAAVHDALVAAGVENQHEVKKGNKLHLKRSCEDQNTDSPAKRLRSGDLSTGDSVSLASLRQTDPARTGRRLPLAELQRSSYERELSDLQRLAADSRLRSRVAFDRAAFLSEQDLEKQQEDAVMIAAQCYRAGLTDGARAASDV